MVARKKLTVGLVFGGRSGEHEVSLHSAASVYRSLNPSTYRVVPILITHEGNWRLAHAPAENGPFRSRPGDPPVYLSPGSRPQVRYRSGRVEHTIAIDVFFPVLHGPYGEDGTIQGLFEMCGAPYVGAGVLGSAIGMDKATMKALFEKAGLNVAPYLGFTAYEWKRNRIAIEEHVLGELDLPCFVKPGNSGSSVGITKVTSIEELGRAITEAFRYDRRVVAERAITGREIECSVLGNEAPQASTPGEVIPYREFYDYWDKYIGGKTQFHVPAELTHEEIETVQDAAVRAYRAVDCAGMARVDFFLSEGEAAAERRLYVNEINTIPGFTTISMYPKLWAISGVPYSRLLDRLIELALRAFAAKSRLRTHWREGGALTRTTKNRKSRATSRARR